jgi:hypothetical protein
VLAKVGIKKKRRKKNRSDWDYLTKRKRKRTSKQEPLSVAKSTHYNYKGRLSIEKKTITISYKFHLFYIALSSSYQLGASAIINGGVFQGINTDDGSG